MIRRETVDVEAHHGDYSLTEYFFRDAIGLAGSNPRLIAVCTGSSGRAPLYGAGFHQQHSATLEFLSGPDRRNGQEASNWSVQQLLRNGFMPFDEPKSYWYSFRAWRPTATPAELNSMSIRPALDAICEQHPNHPHARGMRAFHYPQQRMCPEAVKETMTATNAYSGYAFGWRVRGEALLEWGASEQLKEELASEARSGALGAFQIAVKLDPQEVEYRESFADLLEELGRHREAKRQRKHIARMHKR